MDDGRRKRVKIPEDPEQLLDDVQRIPLGMPLLFQLALKILSIYELLDEVETLSSIFARCEFVDVSGNTRMSQLLENLPFTFETLEIVR